MRFGAAHGFDHLKSFLDGVAHRFLDVDVLAGLAGVDGDLGVPVIGRGHDHRVDILVFQQTLIVFVRLGARARGFGAELEILFVNVADRRSGGLGVFLEIPRQRAAPAAGADRANDDPVIGSFHSACRKRGQAGGG